jgi:Ca-activated chloride channel homolog
MNLSGPIALANIARIAALVGGLLVVAYILKMRRRRYEVPFSKLWQRVLKDKDATSLWRRLKRLLSLMVQLAFAGLLLGAALDPRLGQAAATGRNVVVILDSSASMKAVDEGTNVTRMDRAREAAVGLLRSLGGADVAMVVRMDGQTTALSRFESDIPHLVKTVEQVVPSDTPADLHRALEAASDALRGRKDPLVVIIGDGAYSDDSRERVVWTPQTESQLGMIDLSGVDVRFMPIGKEARNVGIVAFNVRRYLQNKLSYEVLVEVQNFGVAQEVVKLTLYAGDDPVNVKTITLQPGERQREIYPDLGGGDDRILRVHLEPLDAAGQPAPDAFSLDDDAHALLPERKKQKVLIVSEENLYLEGALLLDTNIDVERRSSTEYEQELEAKTLGAFDVVVYNGYTPEDPPPFPAAFYFKPSGEKSPFKIRSEVKRPTITEVENDHPITRWVTLADVNIDASGVFETKDGDVVLAKSFRDPIIVAGKRWGKKIVAFGFGLDGTDLTLRVAFPVLVVNSLDWFAGDDAELITTYRTGHTWSVPVDAEEKLTEVAIKGPRGRLQAPVTGGRAKFYGQYVGIYHIDTGSEVLGVAANLADPFESNIKPEPSLTLGGKTLAGPPSFDISVSRQIWIWLVLAAVLLSLVEWLTYNRRITV